MTAIQVRTRQETGGVRVAVKLRCAMRTAWVTCGHVRCDPAQQPTACVLLTGWGTGEAAATKVKTRKQRQVRSDSIEGGREGEFDSFNDPNIGVVLPGADNSGPRWAPTALRPSSIPASAVRSAPPVSSTCVIQPTDTNDQSARQPTTTISPLSVAADVHTAESARVWSRFPGRITYVSPLFGSSYTLT